MAEALASTSALSPSTAMDSHAPLPHTLTQPPQYRTGGPRPLLRLQPGPRMFSSSSPTYQQAYFLLQAALRWYCLCHPLPNDTCFSFPSACPDRTTFLLL